jgi:hypothetical protein
MINVANDNTPNRHVAYAGRYASGPVNKFNAFSALERARLLLRETEQIIQMFELEGEKDERADWWWNGFEIVPYTLVGLATCLEWHARSRLTDLYTFLPEKIDAKALDGKVPAKVLSQMIQAKVSIPQLLGVSFTVGSVPEYLGVFKTLFEALGIATSPDSTIQPIVIEQLGLFGDVVREPLMRDVIEELFMTRHALVHEIGYGSSSGRSLCETWPPERVMWLSQNVISTIRLLERTITENAPSDFPNLLTRDGYPVDDRERLRQSINALEARIGSEIAARSAPGQVNWPDALRAAQASAEAHEMLFSDRTMFERFDWARTDLLSRTMLEQRLALLTEIATALDQSSGSRPS